MSCRGTKSVTNDTNLVNCVILIDVIVKINIVKIGVPFLTLLY